MSGYCICIGKECNAKRALDVPSLAEKVVQAKEVESLASDWAAKDPNKTSEQIFLTIKVKDREGNIRDRQISISEARMQFYDLQNYLGECTKCNANVASDRFKGGVHSGFGCYLQIESPISEELENALLLGAKRAVANSKIEPSIAFLDRIAKEKVSGNKMAAKRKETPRGIESSATQSFTYGGFLSKKTITTDMLLEMILTGEASPEDAFLFHHFCENIHTALQDAGGSYEIRDFITELSALYGTAADIQKPVNVYYG